MTLSIFSVKHFCNGCDRKIRKEIGFFCIKYEKFLKNYLGKQLKLKECNYVKKHMHNTSKSRK